MTETILNMLDEMNIDYELVEHGPVYTIDDMEGLGFDPGIEICKNLFICDDKGRSQFLIVLKKDKTANLKELAGKLGCKNLRFASEQRLGKYLGLAKGAVSPFGIINDSDSAVAVIVDKDLEGHPRLGVHPNENTATVILSYASLKRIMERYHHEIQLVSL